MSIAAVAHRNVFGIHLDANTEQPQKKLVHFVDEHTILFPAGSNIVIYDRDQNVQRFIPLSEKGDAITAVCISEDRRWLAVAERSLKPAVYIYDMSTFRKRKSLVFGQDNLQSTDVIHMAFSGDGRHLITQTNGPDWLLTLWTWDKAKANGTILSVDTTIYPSGVSPAIYEISINRYDATNVVVVGKQMFKMFRFTDNTISECTLAGLEQEKILTHAWLKNGSVILGTQEGKLIIFDADRLVQTIDRDDGPITSVCSYGEGFIASSIGRKLGVFSFLADDDKTGYGETSSFTLPDDFQQVMSVIMSPAEESMIVTSVAKQVSYLSFRHPEKPVEVAAAPATNSEEPMHTTAELIKAEEAAKKAQEKKQETIVAESTFQRFLQPFHHGRITGMDTCIRKPLIVTSSSDKSVRIWNYIDTQCVGMKYFQEEATSVAIHPSGLYVMIGFSDKLRLMSVLNDDMRLFKEYPIRNCRECRFANGGHMFASVHGNTIQIFNTWTFDNIGNLKGHNGKVKSLHWSKDDYTLISCGSDGAVYGWSLSTLKRENENILKGCSYSSAVCSSDSLTMYAVGSDKMIKEICDSQIVKEIPTSAMLTQITLSNSGHMMFVGTQTGTIRAVKFPLGESDDHQEHKAHSAPVTKLRVSHDDQYLFSCGEDGCVYVFRISDKEERGLRRERATVFTDEILVTKSDLEEKRALMSELKGQVEELKVANEYQLRLKDMTFTEKLRELAERYTQEMESLKITTAVLRTEKDKEETRHVQELHIIRERHSMELHDQESSYNQKLMSEFEKYQDLQQRFVELQEQWESKAKDKESLHDRVLGDLTDDNEAKMRMKMSDLLKLQEEMRHQRREFEEIRRQMEEDIDTEIQNSQSKFEKKLRTSRDDGLRLKGENGIMKKKFNTLYKEIEDMKAEMLRLTTEQKKLQDIIKNSEKEATSLKKEIQERDEFIQDKEKRVYELKKSNQELEKYKFVLDFKIRDLKKQIEPKENDIAEMTKHIHGLSKELEDYYNRNLELESGIEDHKKILSRCKKGYLSEKQKHKNVTKVIDTFKRDLEGVMEFFQASPDVLQKQFKRMHKKYCKEDGPAGELTVIDYDVRGEANRQRDFLTAKANDLRKQVNQSVASYKRDEAERIKENEKIIKELVSIRKETRLQVKNQEVKSFQKSLEASQKEAYTPYRYGSAKSQCSQASERQNPMALLPSISATGDRVVTAAIPDLVPNASS